MESVKLTLFSKPFQAFLGLMATWRPLLAFFVQTFNLEIARQSPGYSPSSLFPRGPTSRGWQCASRGHICPPAWQAAYRRRTPSMDARPKLKQIEIYL